MAIIVKRSVTGGESDLKAEMLDTFYPVGSYYETSDTNFDPNTAWGGTWLEDTAGRVLIATDTGDFSTVGATGGSTTTNHAFFRPALNSGNAQDMGNNWVTALRPKVDAWLQSNGSSALSISGDAQSVGGDIRTNNTIQTEVSFFQYTSSTLQPYTVVKRWHRTA